MSTHRTLRPSPRLPLLPRLSSWLLAVSLALPIAACAATPRPAAPLPPTDQEAPTVQASQDWQEIDQLIDDERPADAKPLVAARLAAAAAAGDGREWARALIRQTQVSTMLGGFETAVEELAAAAWPPQPLSHAVVELFYGQALINYLRAYRWEIGQREQVETSGQLDLKRWTAEEIRAEASRAYSAVFAQRASWGAEPIGELAEYIEQNNYPPRIRGTLRDAVTYLWVELLGNDLLSDDVDADAVYRLDLDRLLGAQPLPDEAALLAAERHRLEKVAFLLADLEAWHQGRQQPEAAFEAHLERLRQLADGLTDAADQARLRDDLRRHLDALGRGFEWWSMGQLELAQMVQATGGPRAQIEAREIALAGAEAHPDSLGGKQCRNLVQAIEEPAYRVESMATDGLGKRSLRVVHRNLERLYFRAYRQDLAGRLEAVRSPAVVPGWQEIESLFRLGRPDLAWDVPLPPTPDYREHATFVTPPLSQPGLWVVLASTRADFREDANQLVGLNLVISDLVVLLRDLADGYEATVRRGADGAPLAGVAVVAYRREGRGFTLAHQLVTGSDGTVRLPALERGNGYLLVASQGSDVAVHPSYLGFRSTPTPTNAFSLLFTDRSIYRPGQRLYWKALAFDGPRPEELAAVAGSALTVSLRDANGEVVASSEVTTNRFGSASGSFEVPAGRLLGAWWLSTSTGAQANLRVEEYKRPTFEAEISDPAAPLRLNRPAALGGSARYYFGLPVTAGRVRWRVTREPVWPRWGWWWPRPPAAERVLAAGETGLDAEGRFSLTFTPAADEREAARPGISYRFRLSVEVTDEGGETRAAERSFRLGFVSVEAELASRGGFLAAGKPASLEALRRDLDGTARAGTASWRLVALAQPERTLLPAEQPRPAMEDDEAAEFASPGDRQRARWETGLASEQVLALWPDGTEIAHGTLAHGGDGRAEVPLPALAAGAYRLHYTTLDPEGGRFETSRDLIVAADGGRLAVPLAVVAEESSVAVGGTARVLIHSGLAQQLLTVEIYRDRERRERRQVVSQGGMTVLELPIREADRGGFKVQVTGLADYQLLSADAAVMVPWDDRRLKVELATFRDRLRPGARETWRVTVRAADDGALAAGSAEVLASMYDKSLDLFAPYGPPDPLAHLPRKTGAAAITTNLGTSHASWARQGERPGPLPVEALTGDRLRFFDDFGIGGPGVRGGIRGGIAMKAMAAGAPEQFQVADAPPPVPPPQAAADASGAEIQMITRRDVEEETAEAPAATPALRSDFAETALWEPHLVVGEDSAVAFELTLPDSVTEWSFWAHAITADLRAGSVNRSLRTVKDLLVRPYLPRFLREGDRLEVQVAVNNASTAAFDGTLDLDIVDPASEESLLASFGLTAAQAQGRPFHVEAGQGTTLAFPLAVPARVGEVAFKVVARSGNESDGELRALPVLPGRMHLVQSRFAALHGPETKRLHFADLAAADDPTRIDEQLVVTLDAQLFYSALSALPYLVSYPYECTEQTLNRFVSASILAGLYQRYPVVADMARQLAARDSQYEPWTADDPNRGMALEETPWLVTARGGSDDEDAALIKLLDPAVAAANRDTAIARLRNEQTGGGGFSWFPGGPPSPYITLYVLLELGRAREFGIEVPQELVLRAWQYLHGYYVDELFSRARKDDCCWELVTFLNFVLGSYPDESWTGSLFTADDRRQMLAFSFEHWRQHSPLLKGYLALTLARAGRQADAHKVWASVMSAAKTSEELGTYWAPEDRAWLWYNDTIESHAFALRVLDELDPKDPRRAGLVQWLLLNKKLNHWKSTRATAEVIYALVHYLEQEGSLGQREQAVVTIGPRRETFTFEPDRYTGKHNQLVVPGAEIAPQAMSTIAVEATTPGLLFASATWHFSTERLPEAAASDFFAVSRRTFKRVQQGSSWVLQPLAEGATLAVGDQLEVQLSIRSGQAAEFVHLRDPRPAGCEPETLRSGYQWGSGLGWYEEVRDSGTNFFFDWLPAGEYTLKYRLRANVAGTFKVAPATLQSMYAPEFAAYSAGETLAIAPAAKP